MRTLVDTLVGCKFERLTVIEEVPKEMRNSPQRIWKCICSCPERNVLLTNTNNLIGKRTTSCGCLKRERISAKAKGRISPNRIYDPNIAGLVSHYEARYNDGDFTLDEFIAATKLNCFYCLSAPSSITKNNVKWNGLDRIDVSLPHTKTNCVVACKSCNYARNALSIIDFYELIQRRYEYMRGKTLDDLKVAMPHNDIIVQMMLDRGILDTPTRGNRLRTALCDVYCKRYNDGDLTFNQFYYLSQQNRAYCGVESSNHNKTKKAKKNPVVVVYYSGLDRIDSNLRHTLANSVPCCRFCNYAKRHMTFDDFLAWMEKVYNGFTHDKLAFLLKHGNNGVLI